MLKVYGERNREFKLRMLSISDRCYWCNRKVVDYGSQFSQQGTPPDDEATIDHTISRYFREPYKEVDKVLACRKCNFARGRKEQKKLGRNTRNYA